MYRHVLDNWHRRLEYGWGLYLVLLTTLKRCSSPSGIWRDLIQKHFYKYLAKFNLILEIESVSQLGQKGNDSGSIPLCPDQPDYSSVCPRGHLQHWQNPSASGRRVGKSCLRRDHKSQKAEGKALGPVPCTHLAMVLGWCKEFGATWLQWGKEGGLSVLSLTSMSMSASLVQHQWLDYKDWSTHCWGTWELPGKQKPW